jgi:hypothetical protein
VLLKEAALLLYKVELLLLRHERPNALLLGAHYGRYALLLGAYKYR